MVPKRRRTGVDETSSRRIDVTTTSFLARLFSKKMSRYGHSPGVVVVVRRRANTLTFSNISVITEDIYMKLRVVVHYQKGNPYQ